jgi:hypothetical protein
MKIAWFQQAEPAGGHGPDLEAALTLGKLVPVAHDHDTDAGEQEEDLLVVAVADAAFGLQDM